MRLVLYPPHWVSVMLTVELQNLALEKTYENIRNIRKMLFSNITISLKFYQFFKIYYLLSFSAFSKLTITQRNKLLPPLKIRIIVELSQCEAFQPFTFLKIISFILWYLLPLMKLRILLITKLLVWA